MELAAERSKPLRLTQSAALVAFLSIFLVGFVLRFVDLGRESYWLDEVIMVKLTSGQFQPLLQHLLEGDRPPIYVLLGYVWTHTFGSSEVATRSLSAVAGVLSIPMLYVVGKKLFNWKIALMACWVMAISAFQIYYSQEFRYYTWFQLSALLVVYVYIHTLENNTRVNFGLYALFGILAVYVHTYAIFLLCALGLHFLFHWRRFSKLRSGWIIAQGVTFIGIAPRLWATLSGMSESSTASLDTFGGGTSVGDWLAAPPLYAPFRTLINFLFVERAAVNWWLIGMVTLAVVVGITFYAMRIGRRRWRAEIRASFQVIRNRITGLETPITLVVFWLVVSIALPFFISLVLTPMYLDRYTIPAAPAWYLLIAVFLYAARKAVPIVLSLGALTLFSLGALQTYYSVPTKEQWRETAAYVSSYAQDSDKIALSYGHLPGDAYNVRDSFYWYYPTRTPSNCFVDVWQAPDKVRQDLDHCANGQQHLWLVVYRDRGSTDTSWLSAMLDDQHDVQLVDTHEFVGTSVYRIEFRPGA